MFSGFFANQKKKNETRFNGFFLFVIIAIFSQNKETAKPLWQAVFLVISMLSSSFAASFFCGYPQGKKAFVSILREKMLTIMLTKEEPRTGALLLQFVYHCS